MIELIKKRNWQEIAEAKEKSSTKWASKDKVVLKKKKKHTNHKRIPKNNWASVKGSRSVPKEVWQHGRRHADNGYIFVKVFNKHTLRLLYEYKRTLRKIV